MHEDGEFSARAGPSGMNPTPKSGKELASPAVAPCGQTTLALLENGYRPGGERPDSALIAGVETRRSKAA